MVDLWWLGVLDDDGNVGLATAIDFAAGCGQVNPVGHVFLNELGVQVIHQGFDCARGVGAGNIAVQPALGVGNGRHRVTGATHRKAVAGEGFNQRCDLGLVRHHVFDVGADCEAHMAIGVGVGNVTQLANGVQVHLPLRASAHGPDFIAGVRDVVQHAGAWPVVVLPVAIVLVHQRMQELLVVRYAAFDGGAHGCHVRFLSLPLLFSR